MKRIIPLLSILLSILVFGSCGAVGDKATSVSVIYFFTTFAALLLLIGCLFVIDRREKWFIVLFSSVFVINLGYLLLSASRELKLALAANTISYICSALLPLTMLMIILNVCKCRTPRWAKALFACISIFMLLLVTSPLFGIKLYYKEVSFVLEGGCGTLDKIYGPLHSLYLFYLLLYFAIMVALSIRASIKKALDSTVHAVILLVAVFSNIAVWLFGQLVDMNFEFLSVSYIVTELFLLSLHLMLKETKRNCQIIMVNTVDEPVPLAQTDTDILREKGEYMRSQLSNLTPTEKLIYDLYIEGKSTKEVLTELNIKENTLKYHNKNIYSKLGVSSRKELKEISKNQAQ
ncbi:MAG: hypothetical protein E7652_08330 [Ruminococcaceae bacterium]|nr:hypothetical protein [Oscillospiraceae bacterium]